MKKVIRSSLLYRSRVEYANFCINHIMGCSHGCTFPCYAWQMAKRYGRVKNDKDWLEPKLVKNALELLDKEIPKYKDQIKFVHLSFMTDPFMYKQPEVEDMTLKIIEKLNSNNIKCTTLTKGIYPKDLTDTNRYGSNNEYGITLVSLNNFFKKDFEPFSASYNDRVDSLEYLHNKGLKTWVSIEPYPTPNLDKKQNLLGLLNRIKFVDRIIFGRLNYNPRVNDFKNYQMFYTLSAEIVIRFCKKNKIDYHIKEGTQITYNNKTAKIFVKNK